LVQFTFERRSLYWRGRSPVLLRAAAGASCQEIGAVEAGDLWMGMIPVEAEIGGVVIRPRCSQGRDLSPAVKVDVRRKTGIRQAIPSTSR